MAIVSWLASGRGGRTAEAKRVHGAQGAQGTRCAHGAHDAKAATTVPRGRLHVVTPVGGVVIVAPAWAVAQAATRKPMFDAVLSGELELRPATR